MPGTSFPKDRPIRRSGEMRKAQEPGQGPEALPEGVPGAHPGVVSKDKQRPWLMHSVY